MMKYRIQNIKKLLICVICVLLLQGCVQIIPKDITVSVNGTVLPKDPDTIQLHHNLLMVSEEFIEQELGLEVKTSIAQLEENTYYKDQVAVLMYHHLELEPTAKGVLSVDSFKQQMELLRTKGFHVISMEEYVSYMTEGAEVPDNAVMITFDDGYESFYTYAFPILKEYGYPATNFVIVSAIDQQTGIKKMTWDQMREMKQAGMSFYSHTYNSHQYKEINKKGKKAAMLSGELYLPDEKRVETKDEYLKRVRLDLSTAEQRLHEELGNTMGIIAFPYGVSNKDVFDVLNELEIKLSFTIRAGMTTRADHNAFRFNMGTMEKTPEQLVAALHGNEDNKEMVRIQMDGKDIRFVEAQPCKIKGTMMYPLGELSRMFDIDVQWDKDTKTVHLMKKV
ncbi:polysaccharide deacetylase family protein [Paenibacillus marinisediminis]